MEIMTRLQAIFAVAAEVGLNLAFAVISTAEKLARAKFDAPSWRYMQLEGRRSGALFKKF
jgi:hypothetical protein